MRVISYNLRKHKASGELLALARNHDIDALCLQEVDNDEDDDNVLSDDEGDDGEDGGKAFPAYECCSSSLAMSELFSRVF